MFEEFTFLSSNCVYNVHGVRWIPEGEIKAVVQISHGMCEYIERYKELAEYLNSKGILVVGHDHIGHGQSVSSEAELGYIADKSGADCVVKDVYAVTELTKKLYPDLPYILIGHSMGSFVAANYIERYGDELDAAVLMGTGYNPPLILNAGLLINGLIAKLKGEHHRSKLVDRIMFGSYNNKIEGNKTSFDWLSSDEAVVDKYIKDPLCGFLFTVNGNRALLSFMKYENRHFGDIPKALPVLLTAGNDDPVGSYGKGVKKIAELLLKNGVKDVTVKLYKGMRHEIHNEIGKEQVYKDIYGWILEKIS